MLRLTQGVVTYMSCVELFVTRIKIESNYQSPFSRVDQGVKVTSNCENQQTKNSQLQFDL